MPAKAAQLFDKDAVIILVVTTTLPARSSSGKACTMAMAWPGCQGSCRTVPATGTSRISPTGAAAGSWGGASAWAGRNMQE